MIKAIRTVVVLLISAFAFWNSGAASAQNIVYRKQCYTEFQGNPIRGVLQIEHWSYHDTHRIYGQFRDSANNLIELEVMTNQPGGVGGLWFNSTRHRESHIELRLLNNGFIVHAEDGSVAQFHCR